MSVGEFLSPMSIDKSALEQQLMSMGAASSSSLEIIKSERERFYDIEEYQSDILNYLKEAEVWPNLLNLIFFIKASLY